MADKSLKRDVLRSIRKSKSNITIMFTDIKDSTQFWEENGDFEGRLMVDQHNRLAFPIIAHYRGVVLKTIGDAIMASFRRPESSLKAAVAIQQALAEKRKRDPQFAISVRLGLHTGRALVEKNDVFGDVVNTAARVEAQAQGDEILLTEQVFQKLKGNDWELEKGQSFQPKGKKEKIQLYRCLWSEHSTLLNNIDFENYRKVTKTQRNIIWLSLVGTLLGLIGFFWTYGRFIVMDQEATASAFSQGMILIQSSQNAFAWSFLSCGLLFFVLSRLKSLPHIFLRFVAGSGLLSLVGLVAFVMTFFLQNSELPNWEKKVFVSKNLFVEVRAKNDWLFSQPKISSERKREVYFGELLLLQDVQRQESHDWYKVFIDKESSAWIREYEAEAMGKARKDVAEIRRFTLYGKDLYIFGVAFLAFLWGFLSFHVDPF